MSFCYNKINVSVVGWLTMKYFFKQVTLFYIILGLMLAPFSTYAATKKPRKASTSSSIKHKASTKSKAGAKSKLSSKSLKKNVKSRVNVSKRTKVGYKLVSHKPSKISIKARKSFVVSQPLPMMNASGYDGSGPLMLGSSKALVINQETNEVIYAKNTDSPTPIASVTKLMTAMVVLDAKLDMDEVVMVTDEDIDYLKGTSSRLSLGTELTRGDLLHLALIASENRAASALASSFPGGRGKFIRQMNQKAASLGMVNSHFSDSTGLDSSNVSTAEDLAKMVNAAYQYQDIRNISTSASYDVYLPHRGHTTFNNTNGLVRNSDWEIGLSKTGYISEAGRCLVMQAKLAGQPVIIVLLDSDGKYTRIGDANRVRKWVEYNAGSDAVPAAPEQEDVPITLGQVY